MSSVYVLNSLIVPFEGKEAMFYVRRVTADEARRYIKGRSIISAIGHKSTADALSVILGRKVEVNRIRITFKPGDSAIAFVLKQRLPEGTVIKNVEDLNRIGYELFIIERFEVI